MNEYEKRLLAKGWILYSPLYRTFFKKGWFCHVDVTPMFTIPTFWRSTMFYRVKP